MADPEERRRLCRQLAKRYGKRLNPRAAYCKLDGEWSSFTYTDGQNGYKWATQRIPAPETDELLALLEGIVLDATSYADFKADEWTFLAKQLLKETK